MASLLKKVSQSIFGGGSSSTYNAPNLDFLKAPAPSVSYDFLRSAAGDASGLAGRGRTYQNYLQPTANTATGTFQSYINSINAPSSVDAVRSEVNSGALNNTLSDIERDTRQRFGSSIMDSYMKGLVGGGSNSDIAGNALAQVASGGGRAASDAYTKMYLADLDRLGAREEAARGAYGQRYLASESGDLAREQTAANLAQGAAQGYNQLLQTGAGLQGDLLSRYAAGLDSNAQMELQRRLGLAGQLTAGAAAQAANTQRNTGLLSTFMNSYANSAGQTAGGQGGSALTKLFIPGT